MKKYYKNNKGNVGGNSVSTTLEDLPFPPPSYSEILPF
jgi:hypothetical protein